MTDEGWKTLINRASTDFRVETNTWFANREREDVEMSENEADDGKDSE